MLLESCRTVLAEIGAMLLKRICGSWVVGS